MSNAPWIDPHEVDDLTARYPTLARSRIQLILEAYWPIKDDVDAACRKLVACQHHNTGESLDYTRAP